jgi:hypothetical protein
VCGLIEEEASKEPVENGAVTETEEASDESKEQTDKDQELKKEDAVMKDKDIGDSPLKEEGGDFDEDEKELFEKLMQKIQDVGDLDKELDSDFSLFEERVESVVDSIDRIENIERSSVEDLIYKHIETEEDLETDQEPTEKILEEPISEKEGQVIGETEDEVSPAPQDAIIDQGQIYIPPESPYDSIKMGEITLDYKGDFLGAYGNEVEIVLKKMYKLISLQIKKGEFERARDLFMVSANLGGRASLFQEKFLPLAETLEIEIPEDKFIKDDEDAKPRIISIDDVHETQVLDPELADEINILQKKATSAIKQLDALIESSSLSKDEFVRIKEHFLRASEYYRDKMFHKAYEIALEALEIIKNQVQDNIDNQLQSDLYRTREMLEEFTSGKDSKKPEMAEEMKTTLDRAMKAYLTNEFEKANLLTKKVMNTLLDLTGESGGPLKEKAESLRKELREIKEMNIPFQDVEDLEKALKSAEIFIDRRDTANAEKIFERIEGSITEIRDKGGKYIAAKELEIKINNKVERLLSGDIDLNIVSKKLDFIHAYFKDERYDDVLVIGEEIIHDLEDLEKMNKETESKDILDKLESLMSKVELLQDPKKYKKAYREVIKAYEENNLVIFKASGEGLITELTQKLKTVGVIRARDIAGRIIESKLMISKLNIMNVDTAEFERKTRKAKNLLKEGEFKKGLQILIKVIGEMKKEYSQHSEYLKDYTNIYRDSLEVVMDRHKDEPVVYHIKSKDVPILRKMTEMGNFQKALANYKDIESRLSDVMTNEDKKDSVESELNDIKFEIYKRKEEGLDISEPLSLYTLAQKRYGEGNVVPAEYLIEVSRRYCEAFMPI